MRNTAKPRSPAKVRARREIMSEFFSDEIPTRDESTTPVITQSRRIRARSQSATGYEARSVSPIRRNVNGSSKTHVTQGRTTSARRLTVHDISKAFNADNRVSPPIIPKQPSKQSFTDNLTTPVRLKQGSPSPEIGVEPFSVISRNIYHLWQNEQFCDVSITAGGRQFLAHKLVMAASCGVFAKEKESRETPIAVNLEIADVSADAMNDVLKFFYTHRVSVSGNNVDSLLKIARDLNIQVILEKCKDFLRQINLKNFIHNRHVAHKHGLLDVVANIDKYSRENFLELAQTHSFLHSDFQIVYDIVSSDMFAIGSELNLFRACATWIDFNRQERLKYTVPLMGLIRFIHILPEKLVSDVEPVQYIFDIPECKDMLYNAFKHHALFHEFIVPPAKARSHQIQQTSAFSVQGIQLSQEKTIGFNASAQSAMVDAISRQTMTAPASQTASLAHSAHSVKSTKDEISIASRSESSSETEDLPSPPRQQTVFVVGGLNNFDIGQSDDKRVGDISQQLQQYDPEGNVWATRTSLPLPIYHSGVVSLDGYIYVIGGTRPDYQGEVMEVTDGCHRYDITANEWTSVARMQTPRSEFAAVALNNIIYAVGGVDNGRHSLSSMEFYDAEDNNWYYTASMNDLRVGLAATSHGDQLFVVGGMLEDGFLLDSVESYNPDTNQWITRSAFPLPVCHSRLVDINDVLYAVGGYMLNDGDNALSLDNIFRYRDETDVWETFLSLRIPRHDTMVAALDSRLYVIGGISSATIGNALSNVECFDVETEEHIDGIAPLPTPTYGLSGCVVKWDF